MKRAFVPAMINN